MLIADFRKLKGTALTCAAVKSMLGFVKIFQLIQSCKRDGAFLFRLKGGEKDQSMPFPQLSSTQTAANTSPMEY
jgi:hypothetical protein